MTRSEDRQQQRAIESTAANLLITAPPGCGKTDVLARRATTLIPHLQPGQRILALTGLPAICPDDPAWFTQFFTARLPECDLDGLKRRLYDEYRVEAPVIRWNGQAGIRVSFQVYNDAADADALIAGLTRLLPELTHGP